MRTIRLAAVGAALLGMSACQTRQDAKGTISKDTTTAAVHESAAGALANDLRVLPDVRDARLAPNELALFAPLLAAGKSYAEEQEKALRLAELPAEIQAFYRQERNRKQ